MNSSRYVGRIWSPEYDCLAFVRQFVSEQMGKEISLPDNLRWSEVPPDEAVSIAGEHADQVAADEAAAGDAVIMRVMGRRSCLGSHVGVLVPRKGRKWIMHNMRNMGVMYTSMLGLERLQLEVMGYYRWR